MPSVPTKLLVVQTPVPSDEESDVESLTFSAEGLVVTVAGPQWRGQAVFPQTYGFRLLSELDMAEVWSDCKPSGDWLFEVTSGGWKDLENSRPTFTTGRLSWVREFLVVGLDRCVSVLTNEAPVVQGDAHSARSFEGEGVPQLVTRINEVLHYVWDPIGVSGMVAARDEYDMYVPQVVGLMNSNATSKDVAALLTRIETEHMGLMPNPDRADRAAALACEWFKVLMSKEPQVT